MKFLKDGILIELILLYLTFAIGDIAIELSEEDNMLLIRYMPVAVVTLISTFFIIKANTKKCTKADEDIIKKNIFIIPVIVAVILVFYGLYSVSVNVKEVEDNYMMNLYTNLMGEEFVEKELEKAADEARKHWLITSATYLIVAEAVAVLMSKKIKGWLKDVPEEIVTSTILDEDNNNDFGIKEESTTTNIKFDL